MDAIIRFLGGLFCLTGIALVLLWVTTFVIIFVALQGIRLQTIILILDLAIPSTFIFSILQAFYMTIIFLYLDFRFMKGNQNLVEHASTSLIPALETIMPGLHTQKLFISTQFGDRRIKAHIPSDVLEKIEHLGFGHVDTRFWDERSLQLRGY